MATDTMTTERPARNAADWEFVERDFRETAAVMERDPNDETVDRHCDARKLMLGTPAPSLAALNVKLQELLTLDESGEFGHAWAASLLEPVRADCDRLLQDSGLDGFTEFDRMDVVLRYLRRLIGAVDESLMTLAERQTQGSLEAAAACDALDTTSIALEYLCELERLNDRMFERLAAMRATTPNSEPNPQPAAA